MVKGFRNKTLPSHALKHYTGPLEWMDYKTLSLLARAHSQGAEAEAEEMGGARSDELH